MMSARQAAHGFSPFRMQRLSRIYVDKEPFSTWKAGPASYTGTVLLGELEKGCYSGIGPLSAGLRVWEGIHHGDGISLLCTLF